MIHMPWWDHAPFEGGPEIISSVRDDEAAELAKLAEGQDVLEIGSAYGFSAAAMVHGGARSVTCVDFLPEQHVLDAFLRNAPGALLIRLPSQAALPTLLGRKFGLIFVDGDHQAHSVTNDVTYAVRLLADDGVLAIHDYLEDCCCPEVAQVVNQLVGPPARTVGSMWLSR